jgi:hypothetical protein
VAAPSPYPSLRRTETHTSTTLTAVFRRLASEVAAAAPAALPPSGAPQLLGFAEPLAEVPPIEDFLPPEAAPPEGAQELVEAAPLEPESPAPESPAEPVAVEAAEVALHAQPSPETPASMSQPADAAPAVRTIRARVRDLPLPEEAMPAGAAADRPQNLVGRLGRRLGEPDGPRRTAEPAPRFEPLPVSSPAPVRRVEPAPKLTMPAPAQIADRGGRPSLPRNRRLYRRATLPAEIEIDGVPCTLIDVSIGGFAATGVTAPLQPNALVPVMIRLLIDGIEVGTQLKARIVYVTQGRSSGRFIDLSPSQMAFLRYIVTWRGESVGAVGTTTLLDAIAGGAERGFAPGSTGRSDLEPKSRWWAGLIGKKVNPPR